MRPSWTSTARPIAASTRPASLRGALRRFLTGAASKPGESCMTLVPPDGDRGRTAGLTPAERAAMLTLVERLDAHWRNPCSRDASMKLYTYFHEALYLLSLLGGESGADRAQSEGARL